MLNAQFILYPIKNSPFTGNAEFTIDFKFSYLKNIQLAG